MKGVRSGGLVSRGRSLARRMLPPIVREFLPRRHFWKGIYRHVRDVPSIPTSHAFFVDFATITDLEILRDRARHSGTIPKDTVGEYMLLGLLAAVGRRKTAGLKILDFGGAVGSDFIHLTASLAKCPPIEYHVVEIEKAAREGARLFAGEPRIHFHTEAPSIVNLDIVFLKGALQYVEDYSSLLLKLCSLGATYFLFVNLSAGDFPTYATMQKNVPGTAMPYWFINVSEIVALLSEQGYELIYKSALEPDYDQSNFPPEYRMGRTCNLLFELRSRPASGATP